MMKSEFKKLSRYKAYSPFCANSHPLHDVHTKPSDIISPQALSVKAQQVKTDHTIRICYAGRLEQIKAPFDWMHAIETALNLGVKLHATWIGDGRLFEQTQAMIAQWGLGNAIKLLGFESDRQKLLQKIRQSHLISSPTSHQNCPVA